MNIPNKVAAVALKNGETPEFAACCKYIARKFNREAKPKTKERNRNRSRQHEFYCRRWRKKNNWRAYRFVVRFDFARMLGIRYDQVPDSLVYQWCVLRVIKNKLRKMKQ